MPDPIPLNGLDGANPLGFLAALGTLALADHIWPGSVMAWRPHANSYRPRLHCGTGDHRELAERLVAFVKDDLAARPAWTAVDAIGDWSAIGFRGALTASLDETDLRPAHLLSGLASDIIPKDEKEPSGSVKETSLSHANGQGGQKLIKFYRDIVQMVDTDLLAGSLYERWAYAHAKPRFRWDPIDGRNFNMGGGSANTEPAGVEIGANLLAFNALELLPCYPTTTGLSTTGYTRYKADGELRMADFFTWPIWSASANADVVRGLVNLPELIEPSPDGGKLRHAGISAAFRCQRFKEPPRDMNLFFRESVAV